MVVVWTLAVLRIGSAIWGHGTSYRHHDLALLFREEASFYDGIYPAAEVVAGAEMDAVRSDYPPYSFVLMMPWLPPGLGWHGTKLWFPFCQILAAACVGGFAWRRGHEIGRGAAWLAVGSVFAMTGLWADWMFGNLGVLMTALLIGLLGAVEQSRPLRTGVAWLASLLKPQMGWLFGLILLSRRDWRPLVGVAVALLGCALAALWWTHVSPMDLLRSAYGNRVTTMALMPERHNLVSLLGQLGVPASTAVLAGAAGGVALAWSALRGALGRADLLTQFAFIGVVNRVCTYHNACDDLLLVFALVWLIRRAWRKDSATDWAAFLFLGATVWAPTTALLFPGANALVVIAWAAMAGWIWWQVRTDLDSTTTADAPWLCGERNPILK